METNQQTQTTLNDTLLNNINDLTEWIKNSAATVGNFVSEQTPLFVQEYLNWIFWSNFISVGTILFFLLLGAFLIIPNAKSFKEAWDKDKFNFGVPFFLIGALCTILSFSCFLLGGIGNIKEMVKVSVAPRVVLVDKLGELTKNFK